MAQFGGNIAFTLTGVTTADVLVELTLNSYSVPDPAAARYFFDGRWPSGDGNTYLYSSSSTGFLFNDGITGISLDGTAISYLAPADITGANTLSFVATAHGGHFAILSGQNIGGGAIVDCSAVTIKTADGLTTLHTYDLSNPTQSTITDTTGTVDGQLLNYSFTQVIRKGSQFTVEETLAGTVVSATLNGNAITVDSHVGTTVTLTDTGSGITTSGEYPLLLTDDSATPQSETITLQVNVVGLASFNVNKDGADQGSLTDVEFIILTGAAGSRAINDQIINITTTVGGDTGAIEITDTALSAGDTIMVAQRSDTVSGGAFHTATLGLI